MLSILERYFIKNVQLWYSTSIQNVFQKFEFISFYIIGNNLNKLTEPVNF